ncbi:MAG: acyltransferase [Clostridia bacterium]|nr:acyltransferase [Clostridia bacterium]
MQQKKEKITMSSKHFLARMLYKGIAKHLPLSDSRFNLGGKALRRFCAKRALPYCGSNVNIERGAEFSWDLRIGNNSGVGVNALISSGVIIGDDVMMGPGCMMFTTNHGMKLSGIPMWKQKSSDPKPIIIGSDVWIGAHVIILPGVKVGDGAVIGAGSVVTKDVPSYGIVAGNPARLIRMRNDV